MANENTIKTIVDYMNTITNPLCTVHEITRRVTGKYTDSNDLQYQQIYRILERMTREGTLFSTSTVNGGNVYLLKSRVFHPAKDGSKSGIDELAEIPF